MADNIEKDENVLLTNVEETYSKAERYIEDNKKSFIVALSATKRRFLNATKTNTKSYLNTSEAFLW